MKNTKKIIIISGLSLCLIGFQCKKVRAMSTAATAAKHTIFAPVTYSYKALKNTKDALVSTKDAAMSLYNGEKIETIKNLGHTAKKLGYAALDTGIAAGSALAMLYAYSLGAELFTGTKPDFSFLQRMPVIKNYASFMPGGCKNPITIDTIKTSVQASLDRVTKSTRKACAKQLVLRVYKEIIEKSVGIRKWLFWNGNDEKTLNIIYKRVGELCYLDPTEVKEIIQEAELL